MKSNKEFFESLTREIQGAYESSVTIPEAEALASKFLHAQILVSGDLTLASLDARMRKTGVKALRAQAYLEEVKKADKKPSDVMLEAIVNSDTTVRDHQNELDASESHREELERLYNVFREAHIHFRGISKGKYE